MKRLLIGLLFIAAPATAGDPVWLTTPGADYVISHTTVSVSSLAVTNVAPSSYRWREVYIGSLTLGTTLYYRIDGSTTNIPTVGSWVEPGKEKRIQTNGPIDIRLESGSAVTVRITEVSKKN
jgi:hypothetical protein